MNDHEIIWGGDTPRLKHNRCEGCRALWRAYVRAKRGGAK